MSNPKVSVVMPAYNHQDYIGEAIESVLNQSLPDFEFIIINDGSTDETESVVKHYKDNRIKYYRQDNQGAHAAINEGMSLAAGEYISIINSDDIYHTERLSQLVDSIESEKANFIFTDIIFIKETPSNIIQSPWYKRLKTIYEDSGSLYEDSGSLQKTFLSGNIAVTTSNFFFKRDVLKDLGEFSSYRYAHDYDFIFRALLRYPDSIVFLSDKQLLFYRIHGSNTIRESYLNVSIETLDLLVKYIPEFIKNSEDRTLVETSLSHIESINKNMVNDIKYKNQFIDDLFNTNSWKITAPLRWFYGHYLSLTKHNRS